MQSSDTSSSSTMRMPPILYGTAWKKTQTRELVVQAVLNGFRGIDTACQPKHYREDLVGDALMELKEKHGVARENLFIQTKFTSIDGQDPSQPLPYDPSTPIPIQVRSSILTSLKNLHTTYLDSVVLHSPLSTPDLTLEAYNVLESFRKEGVIRNVGVSNCYDGRYLRWLDESVKKGGGKGIDVVQNRWYEGNGWDRDGVKFCQEVGARYQSFWTLTGSPSLLSHPLILSTARDRSITPEQTVYKLCAQMGITPLCGTKRVGRMREGVGSVVLGEGDGDNLGTGTGTGRFSEEEMRGLRGVIE